MSFLTPPTIPQITSPLTSKCISLIAFPVFILGAGVSVLRIREHRYFSISNDPLSRLTKIYRAHANAAEYAGTVIALLFILDGRIARNLVSLQAARMIKYATIGITVSRTCSWIGLLFARTLTEVGVLRAIGSVGTYVFGATLATLAFWS